MENNIGIGKEIITGFKTLDEARKAAKTHEGDESIVLKNGTYSLHELANLQDETSAQALTSQWSAPVLSQQIIEIEVEGVLTSAFHKDENSSGEIKDIAGVGSKIADAYLDNPQGNKFNNLDDAIEMAKKHSGLEAVIKNNDGSYSLYRATEEQAQEIMKNPDNFPKIERIVIPYTYQGYEINDGYKAVVINPHEDQEKVANTGTTLINTAESDIINPVIEKNSAKELKSSVNNLISKTSSVEGLEQLTELLGSIRSGKEISLDDINDLESLYADTLEQIKSGALKITPEQTKSIEEFGTTLKNLQAAKEDAVHTAENLKLEIKKTQEFAGNFLSKLNDLKSPQQEKDAIVSMLKTILGGYLDSLKTGNTENIILATAFLQKTQDFLSGNIKNPHELRVIMARYNTLANTLNEFKEYGQISPNDKEAFFFHLKALTTESSWEVESFKNYFDKPVAKVEKKSELNVTATAAKNSEVNIGPVTTAKQSGALLGSIIDKMYESSDKLDETIEGFNKELAPVFSSIDLEKADKLTTKSFDILYQDLNLKSGKKINIMAELKKPELTTNVNQAAHTDFKAEKKLKSVTQSFVEKVKDNFVFDLLINVINLLTSGLRKSEEKSKGKGDPEQSFKKMQESMTFVLNKFNFRINDDKDAQSLIENFRNIINMLDLKKGAAYARLLDKKFLEYINENSERLKALDQAKIEMQKLFDESKEVKDSQMSPALKEIKNNDITAKIALLALNF
jgi:hypothetical protein